MEMLARRLGIPITQQHDLPPNFLTLAHGPSKSRKELNWELLASTFSKQSLQAWVNLRGNVAFFESEDFMPPTLLMTLCALATRCFEYLHVAWVCARSPARRPRLRSQHELTLESDYYPQNWGVFFLDRSTQMPSATTPGYWVSYHKSFFMVPELRGSMDVHCPGPGGLTQMQGARELLCAP